MIKTLMVFQALAEPTRLRILLLLREMELSVGELAQVLGQSQPRVSRHIKILAEAGLVERRKEGSWVFLTLGPQEDAQLVFAALAQWGSPPESEVDRQRLRSVRTIRVDEAQGWFEEHAQEWDAVRSLYVEEKEVETEIARCLASAPLGRLADIGTGTGRMLELFAVHAESATGFDRSPAMLRLARSKLGQWDNFQDGRNGQRIELCQGDFYALPVEDGVFDTAIMHQVLHYAHRPGAVIAEASRILATNGQLLVVDFATHQREELRQRDAHACLGFSDEEIRAWFIEAGLQPSAPIALAPPRQNFPDRKEEDLTVKLWRGIKTQP